MRISELSSATGTPVATLKMYIREGLLSRGESTSATQATYGRAHVERVRLISALRSVQDMPLSKLREVIALVEAPPEDVAEATGRAVAALPPYRDAPAEELLDARSLIEGLGMTYSPDFPATRQLALAITAVRTAGLNLDVEVLSRYAEPLRMIAAGELEALRSMSVGQAVAYAALGTALYEPLLLALRRLWHHHLLTNTARSGTNTDGESMPAPLLSGRGEGAVRDSHRET